MLTMTAQEARETIREIMQAYGKAREEWVDRFGTDEGFDAAFTHYMLRS